MKKTLLWGLLLMALCVGCGKDDHDIKDQAQVEKIEEDYRKVKEVYEYYHDIDQGPEDIEESHWEYDESGKLTKVLNYNIYQELYSTDRYLYDEQGRLQEKATYRNYNGQEEFQSKSTYHYDEQGNLYEECLYYDENQSNAGEAAARNRYFYDEYGRSIKIEKYGLDFDNRERLEFVEELDYSWKQQCKSKRVYSFPDGEQELLYLVEYSYNAFGNVEKENHYFGEENQSSTVITYNYDQFGNMIEEVYEDRGLSYKKTCSYELFGTTEVTEKEENAETNVVEKKPQYVLVEERELLTNTDDGVDRETVRFYDREGQIVEQLEYEDDYLIWRCTYGYKKEENYEEIFSYDGSEPEKAISKTEMYYDEHHNVASKYIYQIKQESEYLLINNLQYERTYDDQGKLIMRQEYNIINDVWETGKREEYRYDSQGNMIQLQYYNSEGKKEDYIEYEYDAAGNLIKESYYRWSEFEGKYYLEYEFLNEYDKEGKQTKKFLKGDYLKNQTILFQYDSNGNLTEKVQTADSGIENKTIWTYKYELLDQSNGAVSEEEQSSSEQKQPEVSEQNPAGVHWAENVSNGFVFSTEYQIEDYCNGLFIVSKNDRRLYGVLDINGKEWIPLEYDEITFLNKYEVVDGEEDTLFLGLRYENYFTVLDDKKQSRISEVSGNVVYAEYSLGKAEDSSVIFAQNANEGGNRSVLLYSDTGELLLNVPWGESKFTFQTMVSNKCFIVDIAKSDYSAYSTRLYNMKGEVLKEWEGTCMSNGSSFLKYLEDDPEKAEILIYNGNYEFWKIDAEGNASHVKTYAQSELEQITQSSILNSSQNNPSKNEYFNDYFKLYQSNNTWKLEDLNGNQLYEERYYECHVSRSYDGSYYQCFWLSNAENQAAMYNRFGQKVIDYGWLTVQDNAIYGWDLYFKGKEFEYSNCYAENTGICYIDGKDVYFFQPEQ